MNTKERESKLHLDIRRRQDNLGALINRLQSGGPMIKGSVYIRKRLCGHPRCRCVRGHPHQDRVLAIRREGRVELRRLEPVVDAATEEAVNAWRLFRRYRVELISACRGLVRAVDRLGRLRQEKTGGSR
jgi:hypothetical protein